MGAYDDDVPLIPKPIVPDDVRLPKPPKKRTALDKALEKRATSTVFKWVIGGLVLRELLKPKRRRRR
jgi:hypothetical protein